MFVNNNNTLNKRGILIEHDSGYISPNLGSGGVNNQQLIREFDSGLKSKDLYVGDDGKLPEKVIIYAVLQKWGIENKNGRVYPKEILERENKKYQESIKMGTSLGEANHPDSSIIDIDRVSHRIIETWWEGRTLMGKLEIDTTPGYHKLGIISSVGDKVVNMIRKGWTIGISSRGVGSLKEEGGKNVVQNDFEIICWDMVTSPSTPGSYVSTELVDLKPFTESTINIGGVITENGHMSDGDINLLNSLNNLLI